MSRKTRIGDLPLDLLGQVLGPNVATMRDVGRLANVSKSFRSGVAHMMGPDKDAPKPLSVMTSTIGRQIDKKALDANPFRDWLYAGSSNLSLNTRKINDGLVHLGIQEPGFVGNETRRAKKRADRMMKAVGSKTRFSAPPSDKSTKQIKGVKTRLTKLRNSSRK